VAGLGLRVGEEQRMKGELVVLLVVSEEDGEWLSTTSSYGGSHT
jgi:hypothetical protein